MDKPIFLLLLLLIPILILLHRIRMKRKELSVGSIMLWQRFSKQARRQFRMSRILRNTSLLLQIFTVGALSFALSQPHLKIPAAPGSSRIILIIDTSASMKVKQGKTIRFDQARKMAQEALVSVPDGTGVLILDSGSRPVLATSFTDDKNSLSRIIGTLEATDEPGNMKDALLLAISLIDPDTRTAIWLFSDGAFETPEILYRSRTELVVHQAGENGVNAGITAFRFRQRLDRPEQYEILVKVVYYGPDPAELPVELVIGDEVVIRESFRIAPGERKTLVYPYDGVIAETAVAQLKVKDDFPTDDRAFTVLTRSSRLRTLLVGPGNPFLEIALAAFPGVELEKSSVYEGEREHDIVIFDRTSPQVLTDGSYILINTLAPRLPWTPQGFLDYPDITSWNREHPVMRHVNLEDLRISRGMNVRGATPAQSLLRAGPASLMAVYEEEGIRIVYLGFDILLSDFPLRVSFPIFIGNTLSWLNPGVLSETTRQIRAGESIFFPVRTSSQNLSVIGPEGGTFTVEGLTNPTVFSETRSVGFYRIAGVPEAGAFAVNLLSEEESNIQPRLTLPDRPETAEAENRDTKRPLWPYLLITAVLLLLTEWFFWVTKR